MSTKSIVISSSGTWRSPVGVSAAWLTMVGGGSACSGGGESFGHLGPMGGGGSGELVSNMLIPLVPDTDYSVTVSSGATGTVYGVRPTDPGPSQFDNFIALGSRGILGSSLNGVNSGSGGGVGGSPGFIDGNGFYADGSQESARYSGGCGGGGGGGSATGDPHQSSNAGSSGGAIAQPGTGAFGKTGGGGAGSLWGGTAGGNQNQNGRDAINYGSGAGGSGEPNTGTNTGGNGAPGVVMLMWVEP